jgi:glycosyltransferase involved in cell wall biosynthesis
MNILSFTAGAGGMYCGSCGRDNALAAELMRQGHDVTLMPVYTPTRTDETNVSQPRVLFGGISVYLQQRFALFRRGPRALDRLWDAPSVISVFAGRSVSTDPRLLGDLTIAMLEGQRGVLRREFEKLIDWVREQRRPDVISLPNSLLISLAEPLRRAVGRPVCVTLQGEELFVNGLVPPYRERAVALIREQVAHVDRFVAVSEYCARFMAEFLRIPSSRIDVVPLGIALDGYERRLPPGGPFTIGYFARIDPAKGLRVLAEAYVRFRERVGQAPTRLEAAGYLSPADRGYLDDVRQVLARAGLANQFTYRGEVDRAGKLAYLRSLDVLSVPATYDEPKGLFLLEAMASGVPVVQPRRGAFVEIVERTGGGVLVEPDSPERLAEAFHALWQDREQAARLGRQGFEGMRAHYSITQSAERLVEVFGRAADQASA